MVFFFSSCYNNYAALYITATLFFLCWRSRNMLNKNFSSLEGIFFLILFSHLGEFWTSFPLHRGEITLSLATLQHYAYRKFNRPRRLVANNKKDSESENDLEQQPSSVSTSFLLLLLLLLLSFFFFFLKINFKNEKKWGDLFHNITKKWYDSSVNQGLRNIDFFVA